jgi:hypothetical protein
MQTCHFAKRSNRIADPHGPMLKTYWSAVACNKNLLFMTHFSDDDIQHVWHRLNEVHRTTALQDFLETPQWHKFAKTQA